MNYSDIDYSKIILRENISLTDNETEQIEKDFADFDKVGPIVLFCCCLFTMAFIAWCAKDSFGSFHYYDYVLFAGSGVVLFGFSYLIFWGLKKYDNAKWKKDKAFGKNKLVSFVIKRERNKYGHYLSFAGAQKKEKIRISVEREDYIKYRVGDWVTVTYLKFMKKALAFDQT